MTYQELVIDGVTLYGWVYDNPEYADYAHIPVINEVGDKVIYQYEKTENCLQLYKEVVPEEVVVEPEVEEPTEEELEKTTFLDENYLYIIIGLGALSVVLLIVVIVLAATRKTRRGKGKARERRRARKELNEDDDTDIVEEFMNLDEE